MFYFYSTKRAHTSVDTSCLILHADKRLIILPINVSGSRAWCKLAYGELRDRVGAEFPVYAPSVDVFSGSHLPKGSGLDLERMFEGRPRHGKEIANTREKIGQGGCE